MIPALLGLELLTLLLLAVLLLRRSSVATVDPRSERLLEAELPTQLARLDARQEARLEALDRQLRSDLAQLRNETADAGGRAHDSLNKNAEALRRELLDNLTSFGGTLRSGLQEFRGDHKADAERLRTAVEAQFGGLQRRFIDFSTDTHTHQNSSRETLHTRLDELGKMQGEHQEKLRGVVENRLDKLNETNAAKLEEMRLTVDEKLHATLQTRLTESFGQVTDQLTKVHSGLGEMSKLSAGVDDLSRIFTNVKSRGGFAEVQLGMLLSQMLAPNQYAQNVKVRPNTSEMVEYAVKLPTAEGELFLPIDAKFPREAWERLESAYECGLDIPAAGKAFETAIRTEGKRICDKYIVPPHTTSFAIMFLPTEGLYAEVMRRDGLQSDIQQSCRVTIAGPSTLSAILNSFQMGFHMLQLQQKGDEVWKVLASARTQFGKFEELMTKMEKQVDTVQNTIRDVGTRTRAINRTLRDVSLEEDQAELGTGHGRDEPLAFPGLLPKLAAQAGEERTGS